MIVNLSGAPWRKSKCSGNNRCVEVDFVEGQVAVRDSEGRGGPVLMIDSHAWEALIGAAAQDGELELPQDAPASKGERPVGPPVGVLKQIDLHDVLRAGGTTVVLAAVVGTGSMWLVVSVAVLYYRPVYDFLAKILDAVAERWKRRILPG
jgi:Domain of unknown function (DUF397)